MTARLDEPALSALRAHAVPRWWPAGAAVFHEGEEADSVILIERGHLKIVAQAATGAEAILAIVGPGELVGEMAALERCRRMGSAIALQPLEARVLSAERFLDVAASSAAVAVALVRTLARRLREAEARRAEFGAYDAATRLARRLVELAITHGERVDDGVRVSLSITQGDLAALTGASLEATARALRVLRTDGLVTTARRRLVVHDLDRLQHRSGLDVLTSRDAPGRAADS